MNARELELIYLIGQEGYESQRVLAKKLEISLGLTNKLIKTIVEKGYLTEEKKLTAKAEVELKKRKPQKAIILAAGVGMRMVPINMEISKGLIEVRGEVLVERIIKQLHEVGVHEIYVVVGFMKEKYEYLIDDYNVKLIVNTEYVSKNNLHSLKLAAQHLDNAYIVPCDIWCKNNPFSEFEQCSWYMVTDEYDEESDVALTKKKELVVTNENTQGNKMIGIAYLSENEANVIRDKMNAFCQNSKYDKEFWETTLYDKKRFVLPAKVVCASDAVEINTYEQLRELDENSEQLNPPVIELIAEQLNVKTGDVKEITILKKGMTNRSFLFSVDGMKYIMRIPGEGTDSLINRYEEAEVYHAIQGRDVCDAPCYINPENGYKITRYLEGVRPCDAYDVKDLAICMAKLRAFHEMKLHVAHEFNLFEKIEFYESLWEENPSVYRDYDQTKGQVLSLKAFIESFHAEKVLTHIDAVPDNFLFYDEGGCENVQLTDWEYAGMQDPHVDIAMFCIYSLYEKEDVDRLISLYFDGNCEDLIRIKIYAYIAVCGLLWSNWCEYKRNLGVEFGEYSIKQYRYAKEYYRIVEQELKKLEE